VYSTSVAEQIAIESPCASLCAPASFWPLTNVPLWLPRSVMRSVCATTLIVA